MSDHDERRKFRRVQVESLGASLSGLEVHMEGLGTVSLYDISYGGAAFAQPGDNKVSLTGPVVELDFFINSKKALNVSSKIVRLNEQMFAVEFLDAGNDSKAFVDKLITNRMVGLNMNLIDPQFYRGKESFSYWFHGPKNTNLFLWVENEKLKKGTLDLYNVALHWEDGLFQIDNKMKQGGKAIQGNALGEGVFRQAAEILSQMHTNVASLKEFQQAVFDKALSK